MNGQPPERLAFDMSELEAILEQARSAPLSDEQHHTLQAVVETLARLTQELEKKRASIYRLRNLLFGPRTEKTGNVLPHKQPSAHGASAGARGKGKKKKRKGHGRNGAQAYTGAQHLAVAHESLRAGAPCPQNGCMGKLYTLAEPGTLVRIKGLPPLPATVYALEKLRCNLCGTVFTAKAPPGLGEKKYDETAASMIAVLKYGAGFPFHRLEKLEHHLGIPLPAATQWDIVSEAAHACAPAWEGLIEEAAQGEVLYNDDTPSKILELMAENQAHEPGNSPERTGMFTTGVVSKRGAQLIALFFTGRHHAGENLKAVLEQRSQALSAPIQMCDGLARNLPGELKTILANCLSHGRRRFVDVAENFPEQVRYVLECLAQVYENDAVARQDNPSPQQRLEFHQRESGPLMETLHAWLEQQFADKLVEPNSSLGEAISYMLGHWKELTLFLRQPGAPLDNNICERALKKAILHRKNSLFYKTRNGAWVSDVFMSLIHTVELLAGNPFDYLCELQRHAAHVRDDPRQWMPWNYRATLQHIATELTDRALE